MATIYQPTEEQDEQKDQQPGLLTQPITGGGTGAPSTSALSNAPTQRKGSGRFTNIQKYLQANKPAAEKLGQDIGQRIGKQAGSIREGIQESLSKFQAGAGQEQQRLQAGQQRVGDILGQYAPGTQGEVAGPTDKQLQEFYQYRTGYSGGPQSLGSLDQTQSQLAGLKDTAQQTGTESGRFGLLQKYFQRPTYSKGQQRLDQLFLQSTPGALPGIQQQARQQLQSTEQALTGAQDVSQGTLQDLASKRMALQKQATEQLGEARETARGDITQAEEAEEQRRQRLFQALTGQSSDLTDQDLASLGYDPSLRLFADAPTLRTEDQLNLDINKEQVASDTQRARLGALAQLAGQEQTFLGQQQELDQFNPFAVSAEDLAAREQSAQERAMGDAPAVIPDKLLTSQGQQAKDTNLRDSGLWAPGTENSRLGRSWYGPDSNMSLNQLINYNNNVQRDPNAAGWVKQDLTNLTRQAVRNFNNKYGQTLGQFLGAQQPDLETMPKVD